MLLDFGQSKGDSNIPAMFKCNQYDALILKRCHNVLLYHIGVPTELTDPLPYANMFAPALQSMQVVAPCRI